MNKKTRNKKGIWLIQCKKKTEIPEESQYKSFAVFIPSTNQSDVSLVLGRPDG